MLNEQLRESKSVISNLTVLRTLHHEEIIKSTRTIEQQYELIEAYQVQLAKWEDWSYDRKMPNLRKGVKHEWDVSKRTRAHREAQQLMDDN